jgi:hypothetical protein
MEDQGGNPHVGALSRLYVSLSVFQALFLKRVSPD